MNAHRKVYDGVRIDGDRYPIVQVTGAESNGVHTRHLAPANEYSHTLDWGYVGQCSIETAYVILADHLDSTSRARRYATAFMFSVISKMPERWSFGTAYIDEMLRRLDPYYAVDPAGVFDFPHIERIPA